MSRDDKDIERIANKLRVRLGNRDITTVPVDELRLVVQAVYQEERAIQWARTKPKVTLQ